MSGMSPVRRLRTKTSDLSDFFRGSSTQAQQRQSPSSVDLLQESLPQQQVTESTSPKSKRSRIPFLGRSRKKSTQSPNDNHGAREPSTASGGTATGTQSSVGHGQESTLPGISHAEPDTNANSSTAASLPPSLGSKFAAHFTPAKHRSHRLANISKPSVNVDKPPNSLVPPSASPRATSFDSTSTASQDRSPTPRPLRPTITVSVSPPEDLEAFNNLFTRPRPSGATPSTSTPQSPVQQKHLHIPKTDVLDSSDDDKLEPPEVATPNHSPPTSPRMQSSNPTIDTSSGRRISSSYTTDDGSASDFSSDQAERYLSMRALNSRIKPPRKKQVSISVLKELERGLGTKVDFDSAEEFEDHVVLEPGPKPPPLEDPSTTPWKRQTVATMPYKSSERPTSPRSCMKPSSASGKHLPGPPTIPLPPPPSTPPAFYGVPAIPPVPPPSSTRKSNSVSTRATVTRPRANTIPSVVPTSSAATRSSTKSKGKTQSTFPEDRPSQDSDDPESLREALRVQRARFDDLAAYLLTITEKHAVEKVVLMKKIDTLEREARKAGRELKGLRYLVMNGTGSGVFNGTSAIPSGPSSHFTTPVTFQGSDDGTDRPLNTGVDSVSSDGRNTRRSYRTPDNLSPNVSRPASLTVPAGDGKFSLGSDSPGCESLMLSNLEKRSSASSFSSFVPSPASSTSSLPLPNLAAASTVSSGLSAIPETRTPSPESGRDPAVAAAILAAERQREKEERRASRVLRRLSSSSSASSTSAASSAYATNLKRGRPPSIAQVLGVSSSMEDVLEKLRPFATTTKPSNA